MQNRSFWRPVLHDATVHPRPVQSPHPPIIFGGESDSALRRVAKAGRGWYGFNHDPASAAERIRELDRLLVAAGRGLDDVTVYITPDRRKPVTRAIIAEYQAAGVDELLFIIGGRDPLSTSERLDQLAATLW